MLGIPEILLWFFFLSEEVIEVDGLPANVLLDSVDCGLKVGRSAVTIFPVNDLLSLVSTWGVL